MRRRESRFLATCARPRTSFRPECMQGIHIAVDYLFLSHLPLGLICLSSGRSGITMIHTWTTIGSCSRCSKPRFDESDSHWIRCYCRSGDKVMQSTRHVVPRYIILVLWSCHCRGRVSRCLETPDDQNRRIRDRASCPGIVCSAPLQIHHMMCICGGGAVARICRSVIETPHAPLPSQHARLTCKIYLI